MPLISAHVLRHATRKHFRASGPRHRGRGAVGHVARRKRETPQSGMHQHVLCILAWRNQARFCIPFLDHLSSREGALAQSASGHGFPP